MKKLTGQYNGLADMCGNIIASLIIKKEFDKQPQLTEEQRNLIEAGILAEDGDTLYE